MRSYSLYLSLFLALSTSCATSRFSPTQNFEHQVDSTLQTTGVPVGAPQAGLPAGASFVMLSDVGKKNTFIIQTAPGNTATAKQTDNTGRGAGDGANGGHAVVENSGTGIGTLALVALVGCVLGIVVAVRLQRTVVSRV